MGGAGFGVGTASGGGGARPPRTGSRGDTERSGSSGEQRGGRTQERRHTDLDAMAPMPVRPGLNPKGTTFYRAPITFEIELIDPDLKTNDSKQAFARPEPAMDFESGVFGADGAKGAGA